MKIRNLLRFSLCLSRGRRSYSLNNRPSCSAWGLLIHLARSAPGQRCLPSYENNILRLSGKRSLTPPYLRSIGRSLASKSSWMSRKEFACRERLRGEFGLEGSSGTKSIKKLTSFRDGRELLRLTRRSFPPFFPAERRTSRRERLHSIPPLPLSPRL